MASQADHQAADRAIALRRNVAVEAERHWWCQKLQAAIDETGEDDLRTLLAALIQERTR